jgi:hypothetical protein
VSAHLLGGWIDLPTHTVTVDLLQLQGGTFALVGIGAFPVGHVTELRLWVLDSGPNYVVTPDGAKHPLVVPSGDEAGIKIVGGFDLPDCAKGSITLDFDGKNSIFVHAIGGGAPDQWLLRPVVRLRAVDAVSTCADGGASEGPPDAGCDGGTAGGGHGPGGPPRDMGAPGDVGNPKSGGDMSTSSSSAGNPSSTPTPPPAPGASGGPSDGGTVICPPPPTDSCLTQPVCPAGTYCVAGSCVAQIS